MGLGGQLSDASAVLNAAINHSGNVGELRIIYSSSAAGPSSTQGYSERYIWDKVFVFFLDLNSINVRRV